VSQLRELLVSAGRFRERSRVRAAQVWLGYARPTSAPFITGDSFRAACCIAVDSNAGLAQLSRAVEATNSRCVSVFCAPDFLDVAVTRMPPSFRARSRLVIHNGDAVPHSQILEVASHFKSIHCVNWMGFHEKVVAIPIGLENAWMSTNGRARLFRDGLPNVRSRLLIAERPTRTLCAFSVSTNPEERGAALDAFRADAATMQTQAAVTPRQHVELLKQSCFVVSPPGNGIDCHRTWEAIYLGAVPVVLRRFWPFAAYALPVLVAEDWDEARNRIVEDPQSLYRTITQVPATRAYLAPYLADLRP
jgi:hypothetical protein